MRLNEGSSPVRPLVAFAALVVVLVVDAARTAISLRQGRVERNAALMANAWHFGSDFAGTLAVLVGLGLVAAGVPAGDSLAAIFVAAIVLLGAMRLARQNVDALMDRAPLGSPGGSSSPPAPCPASARCARYACARRAARASPRW